MAFTRAQATGLLTRTEMRLYDDSRANTLRGLDRAALDARIARTRTARDRARDLLKRQRLAARKRGEGKADGVAARTARKEALLVEILERFTAARRAPTAAGRTPAAKAVKKVAKTAAKKATKKAAKKATKTVAKKTVAKKTASTKAAAGASTTATGKAAAGKAGTGKVATKQAATKRAPTKGAATKTAGTKRVATKDAAPKRTAPKGEVGKTAATSPGAANGANAAKADRTAAGSGNGPTAGRRSGRRRTVSPEKALENTRRLLEAKHERDRTPQPWQSLDDSASHVPQSGYQSTGAAAKAQELHAGEARMAQIHGSMSTRDRHNQGKRDHRNDDSD